MEEARGRMVSADQMFVLGYGVSLRTLGELATALALMPKESFELHVDGEKNNFADWVEFCFGNKELADSLRLLTTQQDMAAEVRNYL